MDEELEETDEEHSKESYTSDEEHSKESYDVYRRLATLRKTMQRRRRRSKADQSEFETPEQRCTFSMTHKLSNICFDVTLREAFQCVCISLVKV